MTFDGSIYTENGNWMCTRHGFLGKVDPTTIERGVECGACSTVPAPPREQPQVGLSRQGGLWHCSRHGDFAEDKGQRSMSCPACDAEKTELVATGPPNDDFVLGRKTAEEYEATMDLLGACVRPLLLFDVQPLLETVNRADSVGFLTNPTLYRDALMDQRLDHQRDLLGAVRNLQEVVSRIEADVRARGMTRDSAVGGSEQCSVCGTADGLVHASWCTRRWM